MKTKLTLIGLFSAALATYAGGVIVLVDYDFSLEPEIIALRVFAAPGTNVTFSVNNSNATKMTALSTVGYPAVLSTNIQIVMNGLSPGAWTFTAQAVHVSGALSANVPLANGTNVWTFVRPGAPGKIQVAP